MSFKDGSWASRFEKLGDEAEQHFEDYCGRVLHVNFERYGLNRPRISMRTLPARLKHGPDYLLSRCFVECQGVGRDQVVKLKLVKWNCLHWYNGVHPVELYVWDSSHRRETMVPLAHVDALADGGQAWLDKFHEGKAYFAFRADDIFGGPSVDAA